MRLTGVPLLVICSVCLALSLLCHIVAIATNHWLQSSSASIQSSAVVGDGTFLNVGLWVACFSKYLHTHENPPTRYDGCHGLYSDYYKNLRIWLIPTWLIVCRVLSVIGLVLLAISVVLYLLLTTCCVCQLVTSCDDREGYCHRFLLYATPITTVLAGLFVMMTLTVFADNAFRLQCKEFWLGGAAANDNQLGFSWGFEFISCIATFVSAGFISWLVVLKSREDI